MLLNFSAAKIVSGITLSDIYFLALKRHFINYSFMTFLHLINCKIGILLCLDMLQYFDLCLAKHHSYMIAVCSFRLIHMYINTCFLPYMQKYMSKYDHRHRFTDTFFNLLNGKKMFPSGSKCNSLMAYWWHGTRVIYPTLSQQVQQSIEPPYLKFFYCVCLSFNINIHLGGGGDSKRQRQSENPILS